MAENFSGAYVMAVVAFFPENSSYSLSGKENSKEFKGGRVDLTWIGKEGERVQYQIETDDWELNKRSSFSTVRPSSHKFLGMRNRNNRA